MLCTHTGPCPQTHEVYGDITPASGAICGLARVEAVVGQFYIAGLLADQIGKKVALGIVQTVLSRRITG